MREGSNDSLGVVGPPMGRDPCKRANRGIWSICTDLENYVRTGTESMDTAGLTRSRVLKVWSFDKRINDQPFAPSSFSMAVTRTLSRS